MFSLAAGRGDGGLFSCLTKRSIVVKCSDEANGDNNGLCLIMAANRRVLGLDLALRRYQDIGTAVLSFNRGGRSIMVETGIIDWPDGLPCVQSLARCLADFIELHGIHLLAIDATLAWREPVDDASPGSHPLRPGVGRWAEKRLNCQSKTGPLGVSYPGTQMRWTQMGIELGQQLIQSGVAVLVNNTTVGDLPVLSRGRCYLIESYPTATWRAAGLSALPGKTKFQQRSESLTLWFTQLANRFNLRSRQTPNSPATHDDLQAVVAGLPGVGLLNGPCHAKAFGLPMRTIPSPSHQVEGLVWIAQPMTN